MIAAIDIGNTRTHIGIVDIESALCFQRSAFFTCEIEAMLLHNLDDCISSVSGCIVDAVVISGVVAEGCAVAQKLCTKNGFAVIPFTNTALPITYETPNTLGADRLANALYAAHKYPLSTVIIVSAGSAVVIDFIKQQTFCGGVIFPGLAMQLKALNEFTDALPLVPLPLTDLPQLPGTSTADCILAGVVYGVAGGIQSICNRYASLYDDSGAHLYLATGGDWPRLAPLVKTPFVAVPDMTLIGTALFAKNHQ